MIIIRLKKRKKGVHAHLIIVYIIEVTIVILWDIEKARRSQSFFKGLCNYLLRNPILIFLSKLKLYSSILRPANIGKLTVGGGFMQNLGGSQLKKSSFVYFFSMGMVRCRFGALEKKVVLRFISKFGFSFF